MDFLNAKQNVINAIRQVYICSWNIGEEVISFSQRVYESVSKFRPI